jgi:hypothetical protein
MSLQALLPLRQNRSVSDPCSGGRPSCSVQAPAPPRMETVFRGRSRKLGLVVAWVSLCLPAVALSDEPSGNADLLSVLATKMAVVTHWSLVAVPVQNELLRRWNQSPESWKGANAIADPGQPFQEGDAVSQEGKPWRRLLFAAKGDTGWLVYYERGGIALRSILAVLPMEGTRVRSPAVGCAELPPPPPQDLESLRSWVHTLASRKQLHVGPTGF